EQDIVVIAVLTRHVETKFGGKLIGWDKTSLQRNGPIDLRHFPPLFPALPLPAEIPLQFSPMLRVPRSDHAADLAVDMTRIREAGCQRLHGRIARNHYMVRTPIHGKSTANLRACRIICRF